MSCSGPAEPLWGSCVHFSTLPWGKASSLLEAFVLAFISRKKTQFLVPEGHGYCAQDLGVLQAVLDGALCSLIWCLT